jgi:hypothetical protein
VGALAVATVLAAVALFFGFQFRQSAAEAERQGRLVLARELASRSVEALGTDAELSLLLAIEAVDITRLADGIITFEAEAALYRSLIRSTSVVALDGDVDTVFSAVFSPDGTRIVTTGAVHAFESEEGTICMGWRWELHHRTPCTYAS